MMTPRFIKVGQIVAPQGIKGEMKLNPSVDAGRLATYAPFFDKDGNIVNMVVKRISGRQVIVSIDTVINRTDAEKYRGVNVFVKRESLPMSTQDDFYVCDLIGLTAIDEDEHKIGTVEDIVNYGASDIVQIKTKTDTILIAMTKQNVLKIDLSAGTMTVCLPVEVEAAEDES